MCIEIFNDGGSVIFVEIWRLVTSRFSFLVVSSYGNADETRNC